MRLLCAMVCSVAVNVLVIGAVSAEETDPGNEVARQQARYLLNLGDKYMREGDVLAGGSRKNKESLAQRKYELALAAYEQAFDVFSKPKIYFAIAAAEERLGRDMDAVRHYVQLLQEATSLKPALKEEVQRRIAGFRDRLVFLHIDAEPKGARITVDGGEVGIAPLTEPIFLVPGEHRLVIAAKGHRPVEVTEDFAVGEQKREYQLERVLVTKRREPRGITLDGPSKTPLYIGLVATGALVLGAGVTGLVALGKHGIFSDDTLEPDVREDARASGQTFSRITDVQLILAILSGGYTAYYYYGVYKPKRRRYESRRGLEAIVPFSSEGGVGGVAAMGTF